MSSVTIAKSVLNDHSNHIPRGVLIGVMCYKNTKVPVAFETKWDFHSVNAVYTAEDGHIHLSKFSVGPSYCPADGRDIDALNWAESVEEIETLLADTTLEKLTGLVELREW